MYKYFFNVVSKLLLDMIHHYFLQVTSNLFSQERQKYKKIIICNESLKNHYKTCFPQKFSYQHFKLCTFLRSVDYPTYLLEDKIQAGSLFRQIDTQTILFQEQTSCFFDIFSHPLLSCQFIYSKKMGFHIIGFFLLICFVQFGQGRFQLAITSFHENNVQMSDTDLPIQNYFFNNKI